MRERERERIRDKKSRALALFNKIKSFTHSSLITSDHDDSMLNR